MSPFWSYWGKKKLSASTEHPVGPKEKNEDYWTGHNVTRHKRFQTAKESLEYFDWRNDQYFNYLKLMPVDGFDNQVILDYGCGPGHDLIGFGVFSRPRELIGLDISQSSLAEAQERCNLHGLKPLLMHANNPMGLIPLDNESIDHIHCSGVLHHIPKFKTILQEFRRLLKPSGTINVMVYNRDSIWFHLHAGFVLPYRNNFFPELSLSERFAKSTDGSDCPTSFCHTPEEWLSHFRGAGLDAKFRGAAVSMIEAAALPARFDAIQDLRLAPESRKFLLGLEFDSAGFPVVGGQYAGIDACFQLRRIQP